MHAPVLTVSITTPQSWAQQNAIKRRRVPRLPGRGIADFKHLDPKARKAKEELLQQAVEGQIQIKKSPTNGLLLDPFQTFPIPVAGHVGQMAQFCVCAYLLLLTSLMCSRCPGLGSSTWPCLRSRRSSQPIFEPPLASCSEIRHILRRTCRSVSSHVPGHFWAIGTRR